MAGEGNFVQRKLSRCPRRDRPNVSRGPPSEARAQQGTPGTEARRSFWYPRGDLWARAAGPCPRYATLPPPSTSTTLPVMKPFCIRWTICAAISSGWPIRFSGDPAAVRSNRASRCSGGR